MFDNAVGLDFYGLIDQMLHVSANASYNTCNNTKCGVSTLPFCVFFHFTHCSFTYLIFLSFHLLMNLIFINLFSLSNE